MKRTITTLTLALLGSLIGIGSHQPEANAQLAPACPASGTESSLGAYTSGCSGTPSYYGIRIFEMGLCTSDPLATGNFDPSSCTKTYENPTAGVTNLAGNAVVDLTGGTSLPRIANGSYSYPYIRLSNEFLLQGSYTVGGTTYHSTSPSNGYGGVWAKTTGSAETYTDVVRSFGQSCQTELTASVPGGGLQAVLIDNNTSTVLSCSPGTANGIVGRIALSSPIVIEEATQGLQVSFQVTNSGMTLFPLSAGASTPTGISTPGAVASFGGGAFSAIFAVY